MALYGERRKRPMEPEVPIPDPSHDISQHKRVKIGDNKKKTCMNCKELRRQHRNGRFSVSRYQCDFCKVALCEAFFGEFHSRHYQE